MEEKLQFLFSEFQSELSGTIETLPGSLLESCVQSFKENLNVSILEIFKEEFMPALLDQILTQVRESAKEKPSLSSNELKQIKKHIDERIESVQDLILVNESQCHSILDILGKSLSEIEDKLNHKLSSIEDQVVNIQDSNHKGFEKVMRRFSNISSEVRNTNSKIEALLIPTGRNGPPHLNFNNPLLNVQHENQKNMSTQRCTPHFEPQRPPTSPNSAPYLPERILKEEEFPFIEQSSVDLELRKELWKSIPKNSDWEKFSGEFP